MQRPVTRGATDAADLIFIVFVQDSAQSDGRGKGELAYGDFACRKIRTGETLSGAITTEDISALGTYQAPSDNTSIRIKEIDGTNALGLYEVHIHQDWVNTTGNSRALTIYLSASGAAVLPIQIPLQGFAPQSATPDVNVATIGGEAPIDIDTDTNDRVRVAVGTGAGELDISSGLVKANDASGAALATAAAQAATDGKVDTVDGVVDTINAKVGTPSATIADDIATVASGVGSVLADTGTDIPNAIAAVNTKIGSPAGASVSADVAAVKADSAAILLDTGTDGVKISDGSGAGQLDLESGKVKLAERVALKKNAAGLLHIIMRDATTKAPTPGLTVTAARRLGSGNWEACANPTLTEPGGTGNGAGSYDHVLDAGDTNADQVTYRYTATGCDTAYLSAITQE